MFYSFANGILWTRSDGAGIPQPLVQSTANNIPWSFTPYGKRSAYYNDAGLPQIRTVPIEDQGGQLKAGKPEQFLKSSFVDAQPVFSPDGRWLAYVSNESEKSEVYVRVFPPPASGQGGKWQVSNSGGGSPVWSKDGRELLYQAGDQMMAVSYTVKGEAFEADKPRVRIAKLGGTAATLSPDGKILPCPTA